jgi:uncharacterized protein (TIGR02996 family)
MITGNRRRYVRASDPSTHDAIAKTISSTNDPSGLGPFADFLDEQGMPGAALARQAWKNSQDPEQSSHPFHRSMWFSTARDVPAHDWIQENDTNEPSSNTIEIKPLISGKYHTGNRSGALSINHYGDMHSEVGYTVPVKSREHLHHLTSDLPELMRKRIHEYMEQHLPSEVQQMSRNTGNRPRRYSEEVPEDNTPWTDYTAQDEAAFHQAMAANPQDRTARFAYADYLEENGRPGLAAAVRGNMDAPHPSWTTVNYNTHGPLHRAEEAHFRDSKNPAITLYLAAQHDPHGFFSIYSHYHPDKVGEVLRGLHNEGVPIVPYGESHSKLQEYLNPSQTNTGNIPEPPPVDRMARLLRGRVRYAKLSASEEGVLNDEQMQLAEAGAWGPLGDHLQENGYPNAGATVSKFATNHPKTGTQQDAWVAKNLPRGTFRYNMIRDGSTLLHYLRMHLPDGTGKIFWHRVEPKDRDKMSRRRYMAGKVRDTAEALREAAFKLNDECDLGPDYQRLFWNPKTKVAWYVTGDSDEEVEVKKVRNALENVPGVDHVRIEAEYFPPDDDSGWVEMYNRNKPDEGYMPWPPKEKKQRRRYGAYRAPAGGIVARGTTPMRMEAWRSPGMVARGVFYPRGKFMPAMDGDFMNPPAARPKRPVSNANLSLPVKMAEDQVLETPESGTTASGNRPKRPITSNPVKYGAAEHEGLQRAINTNPRDMVARGAYADYLEEYEPNTDPKLLNLLRTHKGDVYVRTGPNGVERIPRLTWRQIRRANEGQGQQQHPYDKHGNIQGHYRLFDPDPTVPNFYGQISNHVISGQPYSGPGGHYFVTQEVDPENLDFQYHVHQFHPEHGGIEQSLSYHPTAEEAHGYAHKLATTLPEPQQPPPPPSAPEPPPPPEPPKKSPPRPVNLNDLMKPRRSSRLPYRPYRYSADQNDLNNMLGQLMTPEQAGHRAGQDDPLYGLRGGLADALEENGRGREAALLRTPGQHVIVHEGQVVPAQLRHTRPDSEIEWDSPYWGRREEVPDTDHPYFSQENDGGGDPDDDGEPDITPTGDREEDRQSRVAARRRRERMSRKSPRESLTADENTGNLLVVRKPYRSSTMNEVKKMARESSPLHQKLHALRPELAKAAQEVYDSWDASDPEHGDPECGFGGICHEIAGAMQDVLSRHGVDATELSAATGEQHVWTGAFDGTHFYHVDIAPHHYETGGGYNWQKIPGVQFTPEHVDLSPDNREDFVDEDGNPHDY